MVERISEEHVVAAIAGEEHSGERLYGAGNAEHGERRGAAEGLSVSFHQLVKWRWLFAWDRHHLMGNAKQMGSFASIRAFVERIALGCDCIGFDVGAELRHGPAN